MEEAITHVGQILQDATILYIVDAPASHDVLKKIVENTPLPEALDRKALYDALLSREEIASTAIGNGIAIPHVRRFGSESLTTDVISLVYLFEPVDWKAPDGKPVHTLFLVLAADEARHLQILAEIAKLASNETYVDFFKTMPSRDALLEYLEMHR